MDVIKITDSKDEELLVLAASAERESENPMGEVIINERERKILQHVNE